MIKYFIAAMLCCGLAMAEDPVMPPKVDPPKVPDVVQPVKIAIAVPKGVTGTGKRLDPYMFDSTTKCYLSLTLTDAEALKKLEWDNSDGPPDIEPLNATKDSAGTILGFSLSNPGLYQTYANWGSGFSKVWFEIKGSGPSPPVDPTIPVIPPGPVVPTPPVDPAVTSVPSGFRVMFVYESADKLSPSQSVILGSTRIRKYLDSKCSKASEGAFNGLPEYRFWDKDGKDANKDSPAIKAMWAGVKPVLTKLPSLAINENGKGHVFVIPDTATEDSVLTMLQTYGGK